MSENCSTVPESGALKNCSTVPESGALKNYINIKGTVSQAARGPNQSISVVADSSLQQLVLHSKTYCNVAVGDRIDAVCINSGGNYVCVTPPYISIPTDENKILSVAYISQGAGKAKEAREMVSYFYSLFTNTEHTPNTSLRFDHSDLQARESFWRDPVSVEAFSMFLFSICDVTKLSCDPITEQCPNREGAKKFLKKWYEMRAKRTLSNMGILEESLFKMHYSAYEVYRRCFCDPYSLYALQAEQCANLVAITRSQDSSEQQKHLHEIAHFIWRMRESNGSTCVNVPYLNKRFPQFASCRETQLTTSASSTQDSQVPVTSVAEYNLKDEIKKIGFVTEYEGIFTATAHQRESEVSSRITKLFSRNITPPLSGDRSLTFSDKKENVFYDTNATPDQIAAINMALEEPICIITGAAGTGKTSVVRQIIKNLEDKNTAYMVCCPTGKAAERVHELSGSTRTSTIHRLLYGNNVCRDRVHVIIDEASMMDLSIFCKLLELLPNATAYTLVGDSNQISPIDWGSPFLEMIKSTRLPICYLTTNHRVYTANGTTDGIIFNSNAIVRKTQEVSFEFYTCDNFFTFASEDMKIVETISKSCKESGINPSDVTIISFYKDCLPSLNDIAQNIWNSNPRRKSYDGRVWAVGDRVMMLRNIDVAVDDKLDRNSPDTIPLKNGSEGIISEISDTHIQVIFKGRGVCLFSNILKKEDNKFSSEDSEIVETCVENGYLDLKFITLSYALTTDKAQGSEWDFVIGWCKPSARETSFTYSGRLYTMITRAKRCFWATGNTEVMRTAVNRPRQFRSERLCRRLIESLPEIKPIAIKSDDHRTVDFSDFDQIPDYAF